MCRPQDSLLKPLLFSFGDPPFQIYIHLQIETPHTFMKHFDILKPSVLQYWLNVGSQHIHVSKNVFPMCSTLNWALLAYQVFGYPKSGTRKQPKRGHWVITFKKNDKHILHIQHVSAPQFQLLQNCTTHYYKIIKE